MKYSFKIVKHRESGDLQPVLVIEPQLQGLSMILGEFERIEYYISYLESIIARKIPDCSEPAMIIIQGVLWGSCKSKLVKFERGDELPTEGVEFDTMDCLQMCKDLMIVMQQNNIKYYPRK